MVPLHLSQLLLCHASLLEAELQLGNVAPDLGDGPLGLRRKSVPDWQKTNRNKAISSHELPQFPFQNNFEELGDSCSLSRHKLADRSKKGERFVKTQSSDEKTPQNTVVIFWTVHFCCLGIHSKIQRIQSIDQIRMEQRAWGLFCGKILRSGQ